MKPSKTVPKQDNSPFIPQKSKLKNPLNIYERELTEKQKELVDLMTSRDTKIIFIAGCAGTSKTWCSIYGALKLLNDKKVSDLIYVRSVVESASHGLGAIPGSVEDKVSPYMQPLVDKLEELLPKSEIDALKKENRISGIPINFLRGLNWNAKVIIGDEFQNCNTKEIITFLTRAGEFTRLFICGDPDQSDINGKSGFLKIINCFDDQESRDNGIHVFRFTEEDVVRSGLCKFITKKIKNLDK